MGELRRRQLTAALSLMTAAAMLGGCSKGGSDMSSAAQTKAAVSEAAAVSSVTDSGEDIEPDFCSAELSQSGKPAVSEISVSGVFGEGTITDIYGAEGDDRRFTEEAGLYSCPVRFECEDLRAGIMSFTYDTEQLRGAVPDNFRVMHYNERGDGMEYIDCLNDPDSSQISASISEPGVYMLIDEYARRVALGQDISGLIVPEPQDELYDGEIPYYAESRPFTVTIPLGCYGYESIADTEAGGFSYHTFYRIVQTHSALVWVEISYLTPDEAEDMDTQKKKLRKALPDLNAGEGEVPSREIDSYMEITSPDGTKGMRVVCYDTYAPAGINPEMTFKTICDYYPDSEGGFYEIRAQFLENEWDDPDGVTDSLSGRILGSFTLKQGAGYREEGISADSSAEGSEEEKEDRPSTISF